jgi:hypothetical protein
MSRVEFVALGEQAGLQVPGLRCVPLAAQHGAALYRRRLEALASSSAEWFCFVDGGEDVLADDFVPACEALATRALAAGVPIGYMAETVHGAPGATGPFTLPAFLRNHALVHHGVVCRVDALRNIAWPAGCFAWEVIAYGALAQQGFVYDPVARYDWRPGPGGARLWPSYMRSTVNAKRWLQGLPAPTFKGDLP